MITVISSLELGVLILLQHNVYDPEHWASLAL